MIKRFVTIRLMGRKETRQGWLISLYPLKIKGLSGKTYLGEGMPRTVINLPFD